MRAFAHRRPVDALLRPGDQVLDLLLLRYCAADCQAHCVQRIGLPRGLCGTQTGIEPLPSRAMGEPLTVLRRLTLQKACVCSITASANVQLSMSCQFAQGTD